MHLKIACFSGCWGDIGARFTDPTALTYAHGINPRIRVLLEKLIVVRLVKKFPTFYGTLKFFTVFKIYHRWTSSWVSWTRSTSSRPIF